ncbi:ABC transporter ATP-binding protein [Luteimicrobium subarcticum]|uniref:Sulfonate transport system ATP-binding protein n=1 Tax=Luteimicrobium subarcticum TaxID=620910 RepID=A0A2M8WVJ9_9MICO|nr:ABC transporter ATP-binding protein [Luteimicrobium subarcticum]PJI94955.1 sulfonate transport system ATP-binding protein [Luteimicrobium subarcticum]
MSTTTITTESATDSTTAARTRGLRKSFGDREVLAGVDLDVPAGKVVALVGRSGSGKSTILRALAGLSDDHTGEVRTAGDPSVAFQEPRLFPWRTVRQNVADGLVRAGADAATRDAAALGLLREVGLEHRADAWPLTLSGGEAQRVAIARALVSDPQLVLLDEPFGALDALTRLSMQDVLLDLFARHGFGVLLVTHDVHEAVALADEVLVLEDGAIAHRLEIDLPRPHDRTAPEFARYASTLLAHLGVRH